jgi:arsenate reductase
MPKITVYQKPTRATCRKVYAVLSESGVDFNMVNYYTDPIPKARIKELLSKMGMSAPDLLRANEPIAKALNVVRKKLSENEIIDLMVKHTDLILRPIIEKGTEAVLARPPERIWEILSVAKESA